jgi:hypothetical protein
MAGRAGAGALQSNKTKGGCYGRRAAVHDRARASCTDGPCGEVRRLIIDPATDTVTHLVIQPGRRPEAARLVPVHLVETADGEIRLRCTLAEFGKLDPAEE